jgi:hypothetical protein
MNEGALRRLSELLAGDEPVLLASGERELIRSALVALAASERRAGHLEELLHVYAGGLEAIEQGAGVEFAFSDAAYDLAAAVAARAAFREKLESARSASAVVGAALAFARDAAVLAS